MDEIQLQGINFELGGELTMEQVIGGIKIFLMIKYLQLKNISIFLNNIPGIHSNLEESFFVKKEKPLCSKQYKACEGIPSTDEVVGNGERCKIGECVLSIKVE